MAVPARRSFTRTPEVRAVMDRYDEPGGSGEWVRFEGLTVLDAEKLLSLLPDCQARDCQNFAPTFHEFVELGKQYPGMTFQGYRIGPSRDDERITIDGFSLPGDNLTPQDVADLSQMGADGFYWQDRDGQRVLRVWWS